MSDALSTNRFGNLKNRIHILSLAAFTSLALAQNTDAISRIRGTARAYSQGTTPVGPGANFDAEAIYGIASHYFGGNFGYNGEVVGPAVAETRVDLAAGSIKLFARTSESIVPDGSNRAYLLTQAYAKGEFLETLNFDSPIKSLVRVLFHYHAVVTHPLIGPPPDTPSSLGVELEIAGTGASPYYLSTSDSTSIFGATNKEWSGFLTLEFFVGPDELKTKELTIYPQFWARTGYSKEPMIINALSTGFITIESNPEVKITSESGVFLTKDPYSVSDHISNFLILTPVSLLIFIRIRKIHYSKSY